MNSREVIKRSSERLGLSQRETRRLLRSSTETFKKTLDEGFSFTIPKLGTFFTHVRQQRRAYDLYRKKPVMLPPKRVVSFHPSTVLKDSVKRLRFDND